MILRSTDTKSEAYTEGQLAYMDGDNFYSQNRYNEITEHELWISWRAGYRASEDLHERR